MKNKTQFMIKPEKAVLFLLLYLSGILVAFLLSNMRAGKAVDPINRWITIAFFVIVLIIFIFAVVYISQGADLADSIKKMNDRIRDLFEQGQSGTNILDTLFNEESPFDNKWLDEAFLRYKADAVKMKEVTSGADVNISNYINYELLESAMRMHFLNQIAGAMTGLGILGTFVGLSVGLNSFDLTGTAADITNAIQPLMDGIKVAFHTSIFGLIYSIGFNFFYRKELSTYRNDIFSFNDVFQKYVVSLPDKGNEGSIIKYQQKIYELIELEILNQQSFYADQKNLGTDISEKISAEFKKTIAPEFQKMSSSFDRFAEETRKDQMKGMAEIVDNFVRQMNLSLGDSFTELGKVIEDISQWQRKSMDEMGHVLDEINRMAINMSETNQSIDNAAEKVGAYTQKVDEMQAAANANLMSLNIQSDLNNQLISNQNELLAKRTENEQKFEELINTSKKTQEEIISKYEEANNRINEKTKALEDASRSAQEELMKKYSELDEMIADRVKKVTEINNQIEGQLTDSAKELGKAAETLNNGLNSRISETFRVFDAELADVVKHFSGTIEHMDKSVGKTKLTYDSVADDITEKFERMQVLLDEYIEYADKLHHNIESKMAEIKGWD